MKFILIFNNSIVNVEASKSKSEREPFKDASDKRAI